MKMLCYLVLILGFFMFYQQNPLYAIIAISVMLGGYLYIKSKRSQSGSGGVFGFMKGSQPQGNGNLDDLITLMMVQQLIGSNNNHKIQEIDTSHKEELDQIKQEVLDIFDE